ncbi:MAG TPA: hypothetical protein VIX15_17610 [Streptosporangiaceae bacterium]
MIDQERLGQLVEVLQRLRELAVQAGDGHSRRSRVKALEAELAAGRLAAVRIAAGVDRLPAIHASDPDAAAEFGGEYVLAETSWMMDLGRALRDMGPKYSVGSIDAALRIAASQQRDGGSPTAQPQR